MLSLDPRHRSLFLSAILILTFVQICSSQVIWDAPIEVAPTTYGNTRPRIAANRAGHPMVIWGKSSDLWFAKWNGASFDTPVKLNPNGITVAIATWMGPEIAAHGDTVYVVYKQTPEDVADSRIWCRRSLDAGTTWDEPVQVENIGTDKSRFAVITTDDDGHPIVAFMRFNSAFHDPRWVVTRSFDYGSSFMPDVVASGWSGPDSEVCDCCTAAIDAHGDIVTLVYRDNNDNLRDSWAAMSNDGGLTFTKGVNVDLNGWMIDACPASGPDGAIAGEALHTVFMNGHSGQSIVYTNNTSISDPVNAPSSSVPGAGNGLQENFPRIDAYGEAGAMLWRHSANFNTGLAVMFTNDLSAGWPTGFDTIAFSNVSNGDIKLTEEKVLVAWQSNSPSVVYFRSGQYNMASNITEAQNNSTIRCYPNPATNMIYFSSTKVSYRIYATSGHLQQFGKEVKADISTLPAGVYYIMTDEGIGKFLKT